MINVSKTKQNYVKYINPVNINNSEFYIDVKTALSPAYTQVNTYYNDTNAIVAIDVDDTLVTTFFFMHNTNPEIPLEDKDFGWDNKTIDESFLVTNEKYIIMPAIQPIKDFVSYCNNSVKIPIYVLTGRREKYRSSTVKLLDNAGYAAKYSIIAMKPDDSQLSDAEFKKKTIEEWKKIGKKVILMIGDQDGDMDNTAELKCRIPNYGYDLSVSY